jgi:hypothetical protein
MTITDLALSAHLDAAVRSVQCESKLAVLYFGCLAEMSSLADFHLLFLVTIGFYGQFCVLGKVSACSN